MITTKTGIPVVILDGSKKSITGTKPFTVKALSSSNSENYLDILNYNNKRDFFDKPFKVQKHELRYDNEDELYEAIGLKKSN